jgi:pimeloyl-ACP methyl ester carboxylesterase
MTLTTLRLSETGQKVSYRAQGAGEPLVLIHGVGMQSAAWAPQMAYFSGQYRVLALDMPGHGGSDPLPSGSTLSHYVDWCRAVLETLALGPVNIAGHSMGALIAGGLAATQPQLVARVALLNGVFKRDPAAKAAVQARAAAIRGGDIDVETPLARWFDEGQEDARAQVAAWLGAVDPAGYATAYTAFAGGDATYADRFSQISCPFLAMTGDGDPNSTPAMAKAMAGAVQNGRDITLKGHRHMINLTAADAVNAHLSHWLQNPLTAKEKP